MGFASVYEEVLIIYVENWVVTNIEIIDNKGEKQLPLNLEGDEFYGY